MFSRSILGLDIGFHSIRLVELKQTHEGPIITCAKSVSIPEGEQLDYTEISELLRKLLDMSPIHSKRVITAVSSAEEQVIMRSIFMPEMTTEVSEDAVKTGARFEVEEQGYIPYDINDAIISFDIIREATVDDKQGLEVFFVSAHSDLIRNRTKLLREMGLLPIAVDIDILAITRLLGFTDQLHEDEDIAIIDIGASKTSLCFYQSGKPYLYPHIPKNEELCPQLQSRFEYYETNFPPPSKIIISGDTSRLDSLDEFIASHPSISVEEISYLEKIPVSAKGDVDEIKKNEPHFATAVGLALKKKL